MKAFIRYKGHIPYGVEEYTAETGFKRLGVETVPFHDIKAISDCAGPCDIVVTGIGETLSHLSGFGVSPRHIDYPESLKPFFGRNIRRTTLDKVIYMDDDSYPVFVKPVNGKLFSATVMNRPMDYIQWHGDYSPEAEVWASPVIDWVSEFRAYCRYGEVVDVRQYYGNWRRACDADEIALMAEVYRKSGQMPNGCAIDAGLAITPGGFKTLLVEVNDGYSLGNYGIRDKEYAKLLYARWAEILGEPDELK